MPILNKDKCFAQQPITLSIEKEHTVAQADWLTALYTLAAKQLGLDDQHHDEAGHTAIDYFIQDAKKHTGNASTYTHKVKLLDSLQLLYTAFTSAQVTNNQRTMMALKIQEGTQNCTPGFHTRVQLVLELLNLPKDFDGLLAKTRSSIVEQIVSIALKDDTQSVHGGNRFYVTARNMGFGVRPIYEEDTYINVGGVEHKKMEADLAKGFDAHYGLFGILTALRDQIESIIREKGYIGRKETSYTNDDIERYNELIKPFIVMTEDALWESVIDEDAYVKTVFGIHWQNVKKALFEKLIGEKYIQLTPEEIDLFNALPAIANNKILTSLIPNAYEFAQCLVFFNEWTAEQKAKFANIYVKDKSEKDQETILSVLENQAPLLTKELKSQPEFRTRYFNIAVQKNKIADVRSYIEHGANINDALGVLFSEENKRETFFWLYEHKDFIKKITPDNLKPFEKILKKTKKGREILSFFKNENIVMYDGLFKRPDPLATQLGQCVAYGNLAKAEEILVNHPDLIKKLTTEKVTVTDYSGRKFKHKTAFQLALCAWDVKLNVSNDPEKNDPDAMCEMLAKYMMEVNIDLQYNEIFPEGHEKLFADQTPFDFSEIIQAIQNASINDVNDALSLIQPNNTTLWVALEKFRQEFTEHSKKETVWNPQHLLKAFEEYDNNYKKDKFGDSYNSPKNMLFWRQIIGYTQRFLPANVAMDVAQGLYDRVENNNKPLRSLNFQNSSGAIFPTLSLSGLGYEFAVYRGERRRAVTQAWGGGAGMQPVLPPRASYKNLCRAKTATLESLCSPDRIRRLKAGA